MSHANAALTPRPGFEVAQLVVDHGYPITEVAARFQCPGPRSSAGPTATPLASRCRTARAGRTEPAKTPAGGDEADRVCVAAAQTPGPGPAGRPCRGRALHGAPGPGPVPAEPAGPRGPGHRRTDAPLRARPPRVADARGCEEARQHPRRRRVAVRRPPARETQQGRHPGQAQERAPQPEDGQRLRAHRHRRPLPGRLRRGPRRRDRRHRRRASCAARWPGSPPAASPSNGSCPTTAPPTARPVARHLRPARHHRARRPGPTGRRPTARSNASTAPWPTAGPTPAATPPRAERRAALPGWLHEYNHHRPHTACGNKPPITRLTNLSGQYT